MRTEQITVMASYPTPGSTPRGLAWNGEHLWHADEQFHRLFKLDAHTLHVLESFPIAGEPRGHDVSQKIDTNAPAFVSIFCGTFCGGERLRAHDPTTTSAFVRSGCVPAGQRMGNISQVSPALVERNTSRLPEA